MKTPWTASNISDACNLGAIEFQDGKKEWHEFQVYGLPDRLVFGSHTNAAFLESGYILKDEDDSIQYTLEELYDQLRDYYDLSPNAAPKLIVNERMWLDFPDFGLIMSPQVERNIRLINRMRRIQGLGRCQPRIWY